jgi:hypothetical protein
MGFEQRQAKRVKLALHGELSFSKNGLKRVLACKTLNLSETGIAVTTWGHADIGDSGEVRILTPHNNMGLRFSAVVVSCQPAEDQPSYEERRRQALSRQVNDIRLAFTAMDEHNHSGLVALLEQNLGKGNLKQAPAPAQAAPAKPAPVASAKPSPAQAAPAAKASGPGLAKPQLSLLSEPETRALLAAKPHLILDQMRQWPQFQGLLLSLQQSMQARPLDFEHPEALSFNQPLRATLSLPGISAKAELLAAVDACQLAGGSWRVRARLVAIEQESALRLSALLSHVG